MSTPQSDVSLDPFGTTEIRRRVLAGWRESPARFREDANTEEDFALGGYRDRLVVELAQNAADAAVRAGVPGRLRLTLTSDALVAANTGEPLTAAGVQTLATLRASHKAGSEGAGDRHADAGPADSDEAVVVGRFGVGFAAVLTVTDEPEVHSADGAVRFSRQATLSEVSAMGELADELTRRSGHVPVLRLPYPGPAAGAAPVGVDESGEFVQAAKRAEVGHSRVPDGFDTVVRLPFRDDASYAIARQALDAVDDTLLLALPALEAIEVDVEQEPRRVLVDVEDRWRIFRSGGFWTEAERAELLADRPTEERDRASWSVTWALPRKAVRPSSILEEPAPTGRWSNAPSASAGSALSVQGSGVLHAPTATDETHSLPGLLIASFPLDPGRRRIQPGPLTDRLVDEVASAYADMLRLLARDAVRDAAGGVATSVASDSDGDDRDDAPDALGASREPGDPAVPAVLGDSRVSGVTIPDVLAMVPAGLPISEFDAALTAAIRGLLPRVPMLPAVVAGTDPASSTAAPDRSSGATEPPRDGRPVLLTGRESVSVTGLNDQFAVALASVVPNLVMPPRAGRAVLDVLEVRQVGLAEVVEELAAVADSRTPDWWRRLYDACAELVSDPLAAEALGALPVPLADGRTVHGPRGVLLPYGVVMSEPLGTLVPYGLRVAHPDASSATLERLGAHPADPATLVADPATRAAVQHAARVADDGSSAADSAPWFDQGPAEHAQWPEAAEPARQSREQATRQSSGPEAVVQSVLELVRSAGAALEPGSIPWLGELPLPDADGELVPAASLVLPGSAAERLLDPDEVTVAAPDLLERWGAATLRAVGVLQSFGIVRIGDVDLATPPDELLDLPDFQQWAADYRVTVDDPMVGDLVAVRDLDLVSDDAWSDALSVLASEPELRRALLAEPSYTAWWIGGYLGSEGTADPDAEPDVSGLLAPAPDEVAELDPEVRAKLGTRRGLRDLGRTDLSTVMEALADPEMDLDAGVLLRVWGRIAALADRIDPDDLPEAPEQVRVLDGLGTRLVTDAVVVDSPMWLQLGSAFGDTGLVAASPGSARTLAVVFDLPSIDEMLPELLPDADVSHGLVDPDEPGTRAEVPSLVRLVLPQAPEVWYEHDEVRVAGYPVDWWVDAEGRPHAATTDGLARGLAWATGAERAWPARYAMAAVLADPDSGHTILPESAFD